jgi:STAM-binding protein
LKLSYNNTSLKVETCAILAGIERDGQLVINTLIVPPQTGKSDQCAMTDDGEIELFEAQIAHSVMTLGWIHTHP